MIYIYLLDYMSNKTTNNQIKAQELGEYTSRSGQWLLGL